VLVGDIEMPSVLFINAPLPKASWPHVPTPIRPNNSEDTLQGFPHSIRTCGANEGHRLLVLGACAKHGARLLSRSFKSRRST